MSRPCSVCASPLLAAIDSDLAGGLSIRATARKWRVSRDAVARHVQGFHGGTATPRRPRTRSDLAFDLRSPDPEKRFEAAYKAALSAVDWAQSSGALPLILRAQAGARAALKQCLRRFHEGVRKAPTPPSEEDIGRLEQSYMAAVEAFEQSVGRGPLELAALAGLRSALHEMRDAADAVTHPIALYISVTGSPPKLLNVFAASTLPPRWRKGGVIQLSLSPPPELDEFVPELTPAGNGNGGPIEKEDTGK